MSELSQEQIDAMMKSAAGGASASAGASLTTEERDAIGEMGNISMGSGATTLSMLLNKQVSITTPEVRETNLADLTAAHQTPLVVVEVSYTVGLEHANLFLLEPRDTAIICDLMMGGNGQNPAPEIGEMEISAVSEAMNQMMGAAATAMSQFFNRKVDISPPKVTHMQIADRPALDGRFEDVPLTEISFDLTVEGLINSRLVQIAPTASVKTLVAELIAAADAKATAAAAAAAAPAVQTATVAPSPVASAPAPAMAAGVPQELSAQIPASPVAQPGGVPGGYNYPPPGYGYPPPGYAPSPFQADPVAVRSAQFAPLHTGLSPEQASGLDLILDVPLRVTVELGRTRMPIRDVLELGKGSVVELNKLVGEPVDMLVNGKLIAKGEVVVIDENFGIRVTDIVSPMERFNSLKI